jgi:hypothetical protein
MTSLGNFLGMPAVWISNRQLYLKKIAISEDYGERVVEVMGYAPCQLTHSFHLLRLAELIL